MTEKQAVDIFAWFSLIYGSFLIVTCLVSPLMSEVQVRVAVFCAFVVSGFFGWRLGRLFHRTST